MEQRIVDEEIKLVKYYPNYATTLEWYQDLELCKQVDNRDSAYDLDLLKAMYACNRMVKSTLWLQRNIKINVLEEE